MIARLVSALLVIRIVTAAIALAAALAPAAARADEIQIENATIEATEDGWSLDADFEFELNPRLAEALQNGLSLQFVVECEISRSRWYWFDERIATRTLRWRLWFHALTRQYRLSSGAFSQSFGSLAEAQRALARLRGWKIAERGQLRPDTVYDVYLRMRLDTSQLPRPFQVTVLGNREWVLASQWQRLAYMPASNGERAR
jgi:hypothetical protein